MRIAYELVEPLEKLVEKLKDGILIGFLNKSIYLSFHSAGGLGLDCYEALIVGEAQQA